MGITGAFIIGGIYLAAKLVQYLADELTDEEKERQLEIRARFNSYDEEIQRYRSARTEEAGQSYADKLSQAFSNRRAYVIAQVEERITERETFHRDIVETIKKVNQAFRGGEILTPYRRGSLNLLRRQLYEAKEKCYGYIQYLKNYRKSLQKSPDEFELFSMRLPSEFPYAGKILWLSRDEFQSLSVPYPFRIHNLFDVFVVADDFDSFSEMKSDRVPLMITGYSTKDWRYHASIENGLFQTQELQNAYLGITATVTRYLDKNQGVVLTYRNALNLLLPSYSMINPKRYPLLKQEITVYPSKWNYGLYYDTKQENAFPVTVTQRKDWAMSSLSFENFPVLFSPSELNEFIRYLQECGLTESRDEWLLGPVNEEDIGRFAGIKLKAQLGSRPLFFVEVRERRNGERTLAYAGLCDEEERTFSADDIFIPFDVDIAPCLENVTGEDILQQTGNNFQNVGDFIENALEEFRLQKRVKNERVGLSYFLKWESITGQLVEYLTQSASLILQIHWEPFERSGDIFAQIHNGGELDSFITNFANDKRNLSDGKLNFFVKGMDNQPYEAFVLDQCHKLKVSGRKVAEQFAQDDKEVEFFIEDFPYPEKCQLTALRRFRSGQLLNASIQAACLNGNSVRSSRTEGAMSGSFHNPRLMENEAQRTAVERAFQEKNCYFIQGPPGTGKTTVIRELVEQVFDANPMAHVLIVSQANVAVDNALSGLMKKYGTDAVRIGNAAKISADLQNVTLSARFEEYGRQLESRKDQFPASYYQEWLDMITPRRKGEVRPALSELILRKHRLIGATCVGIANKNIQLENTGFDLVIVDEAGKALPAEILIPLLQAKKMVLIGDHKQLPPVINPVLYDEEKIELEEREVSVNQLFAHSFFERIYDSVPEECKTMLNVQFRMPRVIGEAVSRLFYDGKLLSGAGTEEKKPIYSAHNMVLYNFDGDSSYSEDEQEEKQKHRIVNRREAEVVYYLIQAVRNKNRDCQIAVITPYKAQKAAIRNYLFQRGIHPGRENVAIDTVDAFQGSEAEVVIFCTTRARKPTRFFMDARRVNVALSRAKNELIILGRLSYFYSSYYKKSGSCLPKLADYLQGHAKIIDATRESLLLQNAAGISSSNRKIVFVDEIDVPASFYEREPDSSEIQKKIEEYRQEKDFLTPLQVSQNGDRYVLTKGYEQMLAIQELELQECQILIIP